MRITILGVPVIVDFSISDEAYEILWEDWVDSEDDEEAISDDSDSNDDPPKLMFAW